MLRPVFMSEEELEKAIPEEYFGDFKNKVYTYKTKIEMVKEAAAVYIHNNWKKISDWSDCNVTIVSNDKTVTYYNHKSRDKEFASNPIGKMLKEAYDEDAKKHNPMRTVSKVVLDPTDGDFSMVINKIDHIWISEGIIEIADFIEKSLNNKKHDV
jgi:hypothetical protein